MNNGRRYGEQRKYVHEKWPSCRSHLYVTEKAMCLRLSYRTSTTFLVPSFVFHYTVFTVKADFSWNSPAFYYIPVIPSVRLLLLNTVSEQSVKQYKTELSHHLNPDRTFDLQTRVHNQRPLE